MIRLFTCFLTMLFMGLATLGQGQDISILLKQAQQFESVMKDRDALQKYTAVLEIQPTNLVALCKASELSNLIGRREPTREKQRLFYHRALQYAQRAIRVNPNYGEANFVMALAMGRLAQTAGGEKRIDAVRDIKSYAEKAIKFDPDNFKGYHVLGKWHSEVSSLNSIEKWLVKVTYGGLPAASIDEAIRYYEKSKQLNPAFLLNYLELAKAFRAKDQPEKSISLLKTMITMPSVTTDDNWIKSEGRKLLKEME